MLYYAMGIFNRARSVLSRPVIDSAEANALAAAPRTTPGGTGILTNMMSGLGTSEDQTWWDFWYRRRTLSERERSVLGRDPLVRRLLSLPGDDALRQGYHVERASSDETSEAVAAYERREGINLHPNLATAASRSRQYGVALVLLGIDDGQAPDQPVNMKNINRIFWTAVIDRKDFDFGKVVDERGNVSSYATLPDTDRLKYQSTANQFGRVQTYIIRDLNGVLPDGVRYGDGLQQSPATTMTSLSSVEFHSDRVLYIQHDDALSLLDQMQDALAAYFRSMSGISRAIDRASLLLWRIKNHTAQSWSENHAIGARRLRDAMRSWSATNAMIIDKEDEDFKPLGGGSMSGLDSAVSPIMLWICASVGIPATRLFGMSPGGFGKGDAEREQYNDLLRSFQTLHFEPMIRKFARYALAAKDGASIVVDAGDLTVKWADLDPLSALEKSDLLTKNAASAVALKGAGLYLTTELHQLFDIQLDAMGRQAIANAEASQNTFNATMFEAVITLAKDGVGAGGLSPAAGRALLTAVGLSPSMSFVIFPDPPPLVDPAPLAADIPVVDTPPPPPPMDCVDGSTLAAELGIPTVRLSLAVKRGHLRNYSLLGGKPRYSRGEVMTLLGEQNQTPEERADREAAIEAAEIEAAAIEAAAIEAGSV